MKRLYIIRHAKALHEDFFPTDFHRTPDERGYADAAHVAKRVSDKFGSPQLMITSPAVRAYATCCLFADYFNTPYERIVLKQSVYDASLNNLLRVVEEIDDKFESAAIFGHNPGFTELVNYICGYMTENLPTSGAVVAELKSWNKIVKGSGKLLHLETPR